MIKVIDFTTMTIKEVEKEHQKRCEELLRLINEGASQETIDFQKKQVDLAYEQLGIKYRKISKIKG